MLGVLYSKSEFLAVLTYSNNKNGRRRTETGTACVTSFSPYSFKILGGCRGFHFLWGWGDSLPPLRSQLIFFLNSSGTKFHCSQS